VVLMKRMIYRSDRADKEGAVDVIGIDYCIGTFPSLTIFSFKWERQWYELARAVKFEICNEHWFYIGRAGRRWRQFDMARKMSESLSISIIE